MKKYCSRNFIYKKISTYGVVVVFLILVYHMFFKNYFKEFRPISFNIEFGIIIIVIISQILLFIEKNNRKKNE